MRLILSIFVIGITLPVFAQQDSIPIQTYHTKRVSLSPPVIDGKLDDPAWDEVEWGGGNFRQINPDAGAAASVVTKFKILYDAKNLYIAFKNYDPEPSKIVSRMSRRDGFEGDWVEINIDSYFDKRTAFSFTSSVSGVKGDEYVSNNGDNWDASWDPIWYLQTSIDDEGWIAEVRIPLSQLRFADKPELVWGFQVTRRFFRNQERSVWQYIPPNAPGWVYLFGELHGLKGIKPQKQLEIQPYVLTKAERYQKELGNPYATGKDNSLDVGLDAKIGITSDITLDLTVNPDFGQVEADPSQVNLTAFELFFQERRPFFIEGNNTLDFSLGSGSNNLFYSRRVGRQPQGYADTDKDAEDGVPEYVERKNQSTILGAAKITGKNKNGFSWGILESITARETVEIDSLGYKREVAVEPFTNYLVGRAQQDINKGNSVVGAMFTATNRNFKDDHLKFLHRDAYSGGIDVLHQWKDRTYYISAKTFMSHVRGSRESILETQHSSERFFQRPDNNYAEVDTMRTSLTGTGGTFVGGKRNGNLVFDLGYSWLSPQLELNDIGFLSQTDFMRQWLWVGYRKLNQTKHFRAQRYNFNQSQRWDFDRKSLAFGYNVNVNLEFNNFWSAGAGAGHDTHWVSNADLRGGPAMRYPGNTFLWGWMDTDRRKKLSFGFYPEWTWGRENYSKTSFYEVAINYVPTDAIRISIAPSIYHSTNELQYVETAEHQDNPRYIVSQIDQTIARMSMRVTWMITPNLSLQYWGQPFGASGKYKDFKYITNSTAEEYNNRFERLGSTALSFNDGTGNYEVDENTDGIVDYAFSKPDFNFAQFRSNMVLRWEYIPGSTFFLVWTQEINGVFQDRTDQGFHQRYQFDFTEKAYNVFLMKFTYRFVL